MTRTTPTPERTRRTRTPAERAQEALDVVDRQIEAVKKRMTAKRDELVAITKELDPLEKRRKYLAANPDLPEQGIERATSGAPAGTGG